MGKRDRQYYTEQSKLKAKNSTIYDSTKTLKSALLRDKVVSAYFVKSLSEKVFHCSESLLMSFISFFTPSVRLKWQLV